MIKNIAVKRSSGKKYCEELLCAGFGGQGIMFMGKLLAETALMADRHVTWMPSYGAEVRGGTAYSMVKISDSEIASPIVTNPNILIAMNEQSLLKYEPKLCEGGVLILNRSLAAQAPKRKSITVISMPLTEMAAKIGDVRCANMIAIGAVIKRSKLLSIRNAIHALGNMLKGKENVFVLNKKALEKGYGTGK